MKNPFIFHLVLVLNAFLLSSVSVAGLTSDAPKVLRSFSESDFDSIHFAALKTHAVPVKVLLTALIFEGRSKGWIAKDSFDYKEVFKRTGLYYPKSVSFNSKEYVWNSEVLPAGLVQKEMDFGINANIKVANLSCIACHSSLGFDRFGKRTQTLVFGAPSDSFNPELYVQSIYNGMKHISNDWPKSLKTMKVLFPNSNIQEKILMNTVIRAQVDAYLRKNSGIQRGTPFLNGGPGLTNGVASLKNVLGLSVNEGSAFAFTSIPSLGDRGFRSSLLYDGFYSPVAKSPYVFINRVTDGHLKDLSEIVTMFTIPTMGQTSERAFGNIENVAQTVVPLLKAYKTPEFPGDIDNEVANIGYEVYNRSCAHCHGQYEWQGGKKAKLVSFPNRLVSQHEMNSDPNRWASISPSLVRALSDSDWNSRVQFNQSKGYVAPVLEGLWASAPYLHNGSVPTLWHLLRPETRPSAFYVGHQDLDLKKVGVLNTKNLGSEVYDTRQQGRSFRGHEKEFYRLSEDEKEVLVEFLKTL